MNTVLENNIANKTSKNGKMKAVISTGYGGPEILQLQTVERPEPKPNEVLVRIVAASVTTAETMMRTGYPLIGRFFTGFSKPKNEISGTGFSGIIESVGADVKSFSRGDEVFGESLDTFGTYAEYICVEEDGLILKKPHNMTFSEACSVGDGAVTSYNFLKEIADIQPGQKVLINGASGSLGTAAVQLAKYFGAEVTAVCSGANVKLVKSLGADKVIDYTKTDFTKTGETYDFVYDTVGKSSFSKCKNCLKEEGEYLSPVLGMPLLWQSVKTSLIGKKKAKFAATGLSPKEKIKEFLREVKKIIEAGKLKSVIDKTYRLEDTAAAHSYIESGRKRGNVVIVNDFSETLGI